MKKPKHFFNLEANKNKDGSRLIYFNLNYGQKEYDVTKGKLKYSTLKISTQWSIEEEYWMGRPSYRANSTYVRKFGKDINNALEKIENLVFTQLQLFRDEHDRDPSIEELKKIIFEKTKRIEKSTNDHVITEYIDKRVNKRTTENITSIYRWSEGTGNQYINLKNHILNYQKEKNTILTFGKLNGDIFLDFFIVLNNLYYAETKENYAHNTIAKENKHFRALLNDAENNDIQVGFNFRKKDYYIRERQINNEVYLNEAQLKTIIDADVSHSKELTNARNYILISSFTGLRIGDMVFLHEIEPENLVHESKEYFCITTRVRKSQENKEELIVTMPILKPVKEILKQNNNKFPKFTSQPNIRKCIKKLLKHLKFDDKIEIKKCLFLIDKPVISYESLNDVFTPHDCRSTFVTNIKNLGIHDEDLEPITHPKLKNTSIIQTYDKSNLLSKAITFINAINSKGSELFTY
jgi:hypothetical protein